MITTVAKPRVYIVHPGIDVHFDIVFLNDHCGIVLHDGVFKLFVNVDR